jgi:hypothetical protein
MANAVKLKELLTNIKGRLDSIEFDSVASLSKSKGAVKTKAQQLKIKDFPFLIKDKSGNEIYCEYSDGYWIKREYDEKGNCICSERSDGFWTKQEYDKNSNEIFYECSDGYWSKKAYDKSGNIVCWEHSFGYWSKHEYDKNGNEVYRENFKGALFDKRQHPIVVMSLKDVANKLGIDVEQLRIKAL